MSVYKTVYRRDEDVIRITMLFDNPSASCCAALSSILFQPRFSVESVYMKKWMCVYGIDEERMRITVFFAKASARCCAPTAPI